LVPFHQNRSFPQLLQEKQEAIRAILDMFHHALFLIGLEGAQKVIPVTPVYFTTIHLISPLFSSYCFYRLKFFLKKGMAARERPPLLAPMQGKKCLDEEVGCFSVFSDSQND
jgi:hypothetical protein